MFKSEDGIYTFYVYIITNKHKTVYYTGVTNYLARRLKEHAENIKLHRKSFAAKYNCEFLLYYEKFSWIQEAIGREKIIKGWDRKKKLMLIQRINPKFEFLNYLFPYDEK